MVSASDLDNPSDGRVFSAEFIGTFILMLGGPGTAVFLPEGPTKLLAVSLAFGLAPAWRIGWWRWT